MPAKKSKRILVPLAVYKMKESPLSAVHLIRETYLEKFARYNLELYFLACTATPEMVDHAYAECAGVVITGGSDFHPDLYQCDPHEKCLPFDRRRDELELTLLKKVLADKKPFLGICRGAQALVIASGGTLHQHVPDLVSDEKHFAEGEAPYDAMITGHSSHKAILEEGSKIHILIGKKEIMVTSAHHQAVDKPGKNLKISSRSPGGIAEVIEHTDPNFFCYGLQSHPEVQERGDLEKVFEAFAGAL